jgi:protein farnesyltransferase/geranylgeranyltransferase type-1 subunit alpha
MLVSKFNLLLCFQAWSHRQWILKTVNHQSLWKEELEFNDSLIQKDIRNNSAWNQRWFTTHEGKGKISPPLSLDKAKREIDFGMKKADMDPFNESPWRYIVAIVQEQHKVLGGAVSQESLDILTQCEEAITQIRQNLEKITGESNQVESTQLLSAYVDILEMKQNNEGYAIAVDVTRSLGEVHDPIRVKYWKMRENEILSKIQASS